METFKRTEYERRSETVDGWEIGVTAYRMKDTYHCKIDNVSPGAIIARGNGTTKEQAYEEALKRAKARLSLTRRLQVTREVLTAMQKGMQLLTDELEQLEKAAQNVAETDDPEPGTSA